MTEKTEDLYYEPKFGWPAATLWICVAFFAIGGFTAVKIFEILHSCP